MQHSASGLDTTSTGTLTDVSKKVGMEIDVEKTTRCSHQNVGQNQDKKKLFENVTQFKYLGLTVINKKWIQEEIKMR
jgi:hypothetical protein